MSDTETLATDAILKGHNVCVLGQPGTGKTHLLLKLANVLNSKGKRVVKTASTGIASVSIGGQTIHKYAGIRDGTLSRQQVLDKIYEEGSGKKIREIKDTDVLIIDELSMISAKILFDIEYVLRAIRENSLPFGGIQVIVSGDFYQLKPVPSAKDPGFLPIQPEHVERFRELIPHHFVLTKVYRQTEGMLLEAVHSLCKGVVTDRVDNFLKQLTQQPQPESTKLYARTLDVDIANLKGLAAAHGTSTTYASIDGGNVTLLAKKGSPASKHFCVKPNVPVVLITNISDTLVNGLHGEVKQCSPDQLMIKFQNGQSVALNRVTFSLKDASGNEVAWRKQYPVRLAYAYTVHKAQGMTLNSIDIDAMNMTNPGQLGVALGRATTIAGISLRNYELRNVRRQPTYIEQYYSSHSKPLAQDCSCCQAQKQQTGEKCTAESQTNVAAASQISNETSCSDSDPVDEQDEQMTEDIAALDQAVLNNLAQMKYTNPITDNQIDLNSAITSITNIDIRDARCVFLTSVWSNIFAVFKAKSNMETIANKDATALYKGIHAYLCSARYKRSVEEFMGTIHLKSEDTKYRLCYSIVEQIRLEILQKALASLKKDSSVITAEKPIALDEHSLANIRHIAGWCMAKLMHHKKQLIRRNLNDEENVGYIEDLRAELLKLENTMLGTDDIDKEDPSMATILRKEYRPGALQTVDEKTFVFFQALDRAIQTLETKATMLAHKGDMYVFIGEQISTNQELTRLWQEATGFDNVEILHEVYHKYITFSASNYVKTLKETMNVKRKFQHRKEIHRSTQSTSTASTSSVKATKKQKTAAQYPCGICSKECKTSTVMCETCDKWFHFRCLGLRGTEPELAEDAPAWMCKHCRKDK